MKVDCPTCEYEFETTAGLQCPRCGDSISCQTIGCDTCQACSNPLAQLKQQLVSRVSFSDSSKPTQSDV